MATVDQTREYYDDQAGVYDLKTGFDRESGNAYNLRRYFEPLLDEVLPTTGRVLELGCGTGFYTEWLAKRGLDVVAMDISPSMVERARRRCEADVILAVGDCEDPAASLPAEARAGSFDLIVGINTFSYYPDKLAALCRYWDLLNERGQLVMLDMNGTSFTQQLAYLVNLRGARRFAENVSESTPTSLNSMLQHAGFKVERMQRFCFMPNAMSRVGVALWTPFERILTGLPFLRKFAIRILWVARKMPRSE